MKKLLALALALMMLLRAAAVVHAEDVEIIYMASQDWVQDAEMELADIFTEKTGIKVDFQIIPADQYTKERCGPERRALGRHRGSPGRRRDLCGRETVRTARAGPFRRVGRCLQQEGV